MLRIHSSVLATIIVLLICKSSYGQLTWSNRYLLIEPSATDKFVTSEFTFTNSGDHPITITNVHPSCDCTVAKWDQKQYARGESGKVIVTVSTEHFKGRGIHSKEIAVTTDDKNESMVLLWMRIDFTKAEAATPKPSYAAVPKLIEWKVGEEKSPKFAIVRIAPGSTTRLVRATSSSELFSVTLEPPNDKQASRITVVPKETSQKATATISFETDPATPQPVAQSIVVTIVEPEKDKPTTQPGQ